MAKREYHFIRTSVTHPSNVPSSSLTIDEVITRKADLENDQEYLALAEAYWNLQGRKYDLEKDELWTMLDWRIDFEIKSKRKPNYYGKDVEKHFFVEKELYQALRNYVNNP